MEDELKKKWKTTSKKKNENGRRPQKKYENGRRPQKKIEDEPINQNQPNWL